MTIKFTINVEGRNKHIKYVDELNPANNNDDAPINAGASKEFAAEKSGDGNGVVQVSVALLKDDQHKPVPKCSTPKDGCKFTIVDADL